METAVLDKGIDLKNQINCLEHEVNMMIAICRNEEDKKRRRGWFRGTDDSTEAQRLVVAYEYYELCPNPRYPSTNRSPHSLFNLSTDDITSMIKSRRDKIAELKQQLEAL